jgi:signal transduction histidine kinase
MISVLLINPDPTFRSAVDAAATQAFDPARVVDCATQAAAIERPVVDGEILLLREPSARDLALASSATDESGLPRWALAVVGEDWAEEWAPVAPPDADIPLLKQVLKSALAQHRLKRECARARGDLWTMARRVTHDLRTPIGCVVTASDALLELLPPDDENRPLVKSINDSSGEIARIVERVSLVARATADTVPRERVDMTTVFAAVRDRLQATIATRGAQLTEPEEWPQVRGVGLWLESVWRDLLENALQHGGPLPRIETGWSRRDRVATFWIRDHGRGVPPELGDRLFQPFHRLHELNAAPGLGLAIVRRLVELQGGTVAYEAMPDGGARFSFTLPAVESHAGSAGSWTGAGAHAKIDSSVHFAPHTGER